MLKALIFSLHTESYSPFLIYSNIFQNGKLILTKEEKLIEKHSQIFFLKFISLSPHWQVFQRN